MPVLPAVTLRPATEADRLLLWAWRNDPDTRQASFTDAAVPLATHTSWFKAALRRTSRRRLFVAQVSGTAVGMVRLDLWRRGAWVSINLAPEWRGQGIGPVALRLVATEAFSRHGVSRLLAQVKAENRASRIAFERAGFTLTRPGPVLTFTHDSP